MVKIRIPKSEEQLLGLLGKINKRHECDKKKSLLNGAVNMDRLVEKSIKIKKFKDLDSTPSVKNQPFDLSKRKDLRFISNEIRSIRNLLLAVYPDEPKLIKEWGFEIND